MKSESIVKLAAALSKAQAEMPTVKMDAKNAFLKNKYATLGAIIHDTKDIIAKHGLSVSQFSLGDGERIGVQTILMHESGEWIENEMWLKLGNAKGLSEAQAAGSIITYLRRYSLSSVLGIYAYEDGDENDENTPQRAQKPRKVESSTQAPKNAPEANLNVSDVNYPDFVMDVYTSKGEPYASIEDEQLGFMRRAIEKRDGETPSDDNKLKLKAIDAIIEARKGNQFAGLPELD